MSANPGKDGDDATVRTSGRIPYIRAVSAPPALAWVFTPAAREILAMRAVRGGIRRLRGAIPPGG